MSYNMMEAYQVKMEQLADDLKAVRGARQFARPPLLAETREWLQRLFGRRPRAPLVREQAL